MTVDEIQSGNIKSGTKFTRQIVDCNYQEQYRSQCSEICTVISLIPVVETEKYDENYSGELGPYKLTYMIDSTRVVRKCYLVVQESTVHGFLVNGDQFKIILSSQRVQPLPSSDQIPQQTSIASSDQMPVQTSLDSMQTDLNEDDDENETIDAQNKGIADIQNAFQKTKISTNLTPSGLQKSDQLVQSVNNALNKSKTAHATIEKLFQKFTPKIIPTFDSDSVVLVKNQLLEGHEFFGSKFDIFRSYPRIFQIVMAGYPSDLVSLITEITNKNGNELRNDKIESLSAEINALEINEQSQSQLVETSRKEKFKKLLELDTVKKSLMGNMHDDIFNYTIQFNGSTYNAITLAVFGRQRGILDILLFVLNKTYSQNDVKSYLNQNINKVFFDVDISKDIACDIDVLNTFVFAELNKPKNITHLILTYGNGNQIEKFEQVTDAIGDVVAPIFHRSGDDGINSAIMTDLLTYLETQANKIGNTQIVKNNVWARRLNTIFNIIMFFPIFGMMVIDLCVQVSAGGVGFGYLISGGALAAVLEIIKIMIYTYPRLMLSRLKNNMWNRFTTSSTLEGIISNLDPTIAKYNLKKVIKYLDEAKKKVWVARTHRKILHAIYDVAKKRKWLNNDDLNNDDFKSEKKILEDSFHSLSFHNATRWMRSRNGGKKRARPHRTRKNRRNTKLNQT